MNSAQAIELFLEMMSAERGASDNTLSAYKRDLEDWAHLVAKAKRDLLSVGTGSLEAVLAAWAKQGLAPSTACLLYTSPSPRDLSTSRMPSSA